MTPARPAVRLEIAGAGTAPLAWRTARGELTLDRPRVMGILNITPDSFWTEGRHSAVDAALAAAEALHADGADILDVGGESTRPGARPVAADEELRRVLPVVTAILRRFPDLPLSIDTVKSEVALGALEAGAAVVNDVSGLCIDPGIARVVADAGAGLVLAHSRGSVAEMASYELAVYGPDPVAEIVAELESARRKARDAGVDDAAIVLDPGIGFAKRTEHSVAALAGVDRLAALGHPVLVGPSRKRFVGELAGGLPPGERLEGTIGACVAALFRGARIFRVHDVRPVRRALDVAEAVRTAS